MFSLRSISKRSLPWITLVVVLVVGLRLVLPYAVLDYANKRLDKIPNYDGKIEDVSISLFRGAYTLYGTKLVKTTGSVPVPFFDSSEIDFSVEWSALFKGKLVGEIVLTNPVINFVASTNAKTSQTEIDSEWLSAIKDLFPLRLNHFAIDNGQVKFKNFTSNPHVDIGLTNVSVEGKNFSNTRSTTSDNVATVSARAVAQKSGAVALDATLEPARAKPTFKIVSSLEKLPVKELNEFFKAYAAFDAEGGTINVYSEVSAKDGKIDGYVKPMIKNFSVFKPSADLDNPLMFIWQGIVGLLVEIFENQRKDLLATEIHFTGDVDKPEPALFSSFLTLLSNAYIESLKSGTDGKFTLSKQTAAVGSPAKSKDDEIALR